MNHLIVYSHPNPKSFNHAILEVYEQALVEQGHEVRVRDLYAMDFNPVLSADDLSMVKQGTSAADVSAEQGHVRWADVVTMICPIWWGGVTSNLRGYIDRVFSVGFAYGFGPGGLKRLLTGKKIVFINTMGESYAAYEKSGMLKSITTTLDDCMSDFTGIEAAAHLFFGSVTVCSPQQRLEMLEEVKALASRFTP